MELWQSGDLLQLLVAQTSKAFVEEMQKGNVNGALKLLTWITEFSL